MQESVLPATHSCFCRMQNTVTGISLAMVSYILSDVSHVALVLGGKVLG